MRVFFSLVAGILFFVTGAMAQKVPQANLDKLIKDYGRDGYTLEHIYEPNFNSKNPNTLSRFVPCYTGKEVIIVAIMAFKPADLVFKVLLHGKEAPKSHEVENLSKNGGTLYYDYRALKFGAKFVSTNQSCLDIMLYDKAAQDKPVYTLIFTKPIK